MQYKHLQDIQDELESDENDIPELGELENPLEYAKLDEEIERRRRELLSKFYKKQDKKRKKRKLV